VHVSTLFFGFSSPALCNFSNSSHGTPFISCKFFFHWCNIFYLDNLIIKRYAFLLSWPYLALWLPPPKDLRVRAMKNWDSFSKFVGRGNWIFFPLPSLFSTIMISKLSSRLVYCPFGVFLRWGKNLWGEGSVSNHLDFLVSYRDSR